MQNTIEVSLTMFRGAGVFQLKACENEGSNRTKKCKKNYKKNSTRSKLNASKWSNESFGEKLE